MKDSVESPEEMENQVYSFLYKVTLTFKVKYLNKTKQYFLGYQDVLGYKINGGKLRPKEKAEA